MTAPRKTAAGLFLAALCLALSGVANGQPLPRTQPQPRPQTLPQTPSPVARPTPPTQPKLAPTTQPRQTPSLPRLPQVTPPKQAPSKQTPVKKQTDTSKQLPSKQQPAKKQDLTKQPSNQQPTKQLSKQQPPAKKQDLTRQPPAKKQGQTKLSQAVRPKAPAQVKAPTTAGAVRVSTTQYASKYGVKLKNGGHAYRGIHHRHWTQKHYCHKWRCWCWYCPGTTVWYYWVGDRGVYLPVNYITVVQPTVIPLDETSETVIPPESSEVEEVENGEELNLPDPPSE